MRSIQPPGFLPELTPHYTKMWEATEKIDDKGLSLEETQSLIGLTDIAFKNLADGYTEDFRDIISINMPFMELRNKEGVHIGIWPIKGDLIAEKIKQNKGKKYLESLSNMYADIFSNEWGEDELPPSTLIESIGNLGDKDTVTIACIIPKDSFTPIPVGVAITSLATKEQLAEKISSITETTTGLSLDREFLTNLPENAIYWDELFLHPKLRFGVEPFRSLSRALLEQNMTIEGVDEGTPIVLFTKGHRALTLRNKSELRHLCPDRRAIDTVIHLLDNMEQDKAIQLLEREFMYNFEERDKILNYIKDLQPRKKLPIMKQAQQLRMKAIEIPLLNEHDRYVFTIPIGQSLSLSRQPNRLLLTSKAAEINIKNYFNN